MEFPGGGGSTARPSGTENPGGWGGQTGKTLRGGGMDIFWNHTIHKLDILKSSSAVKASLRLFSHKFVHRLALCATVHKENYRKYK